MLVEAQERLIKLTRLVTGVGPETGQPGKPPTPETPALPVLDLSSEALKRMPVEHLAALQRVIEMVDGTTIKRELPMPPPIKH